MQKAILQLILLGLAGQTQASCFVGDLTLRGKYIVKSVEPGKLRCGKHLEKNRDRRSLTISECIISVAEEGKVGKGNLSILADSKYCNVKPGEQLKQVPIGVCCEWVPEIDCSGTKTGLDYSKSLKREELVCGAKAHAYIPDKKSQEHPEK